MISESQIRGAIKKVTAEEVSIIDLRDDGHRGAGRFMFRVRRCFDTVISEFYAVYVRQGKRHIAKVALYHPEGRDGGMTLAAARQRFREEFQPEILKGKALSRRTRVKAGTVAELFQAYIARLKADGKRGAIQAEYVLLTGGHNAADSIGRDTLAAAVEAKDITPFLAAIFNRGSRAMAAQARAYLSAAFAFGMESEHDYRRKSAAATVWGLKMNPVLSIPTDHEAVKPGQRFLSPIELRLFWNWLVEKEKNSRLSPTLRLLMATGQRVEEILRITTTAYEKSRAMLFWEKTKNGRPHSIPLPGIAVEIIDKLIPNKRGLYFWNDHHPESPSAGTGLPAIIVEFLKDHPDIPHFVPKDMRRTWKTLAGDAGISKEMRDRIQNHSKSDVSSRHYDRYEYLAEKRAAMATWEKYLDRVLSGEIKEIGQQDSNIVPIGRSAAA